MMFGLREPFTYRECEGCGSLALVDPPDDLSPYYPAEHYYSLGAPPRPPPPVRLAKRLRAEAAVRGHRRLAWLLGAGGELPPWLEWLARAGLDRDAAICDIGSGGGARLLSLKYEGFTDLSGADPFLPETTVVEGIRIYKATVDQLEADYDLLMLNHSFEHMPDPAGSLRSLRRLLRPGSTLMLRLPVAGSWAWRHYGTDWVGLDPPRHLAIPSDPGLRTLAASEDMEVFDVIYDSQAIQFWRSEQYRMDIPLIDPRSHQVDPSSSPFSRAQIKAWQRQAEQLNARSDGDTAAFFLRVAPARDS